MRAAYALVRRGKGLRIRGGTARAYYVGIESAVPAVPGLEPPVSAMCVAPFGMEEGTEAALPAHELGVVVGEPERGERVERALGDLGAADPARLQREADRLLRAQHRHQAEVLEDQPGGDLECVEAFGGGTQAFEAMARQNLAMYERAMKMFSPFGGGMSGSPRGEAEGRATNGAAAEPKTSEEISELKSEIEVMRRQLAELARERK